MNKLNETIDALVSVVTVADLLGTSEFRWNQAKLARELNVNRATVREYMHDRKGQHHCIRYFNGVVQLMTLTYKAKSNDPS